MSAFPIGDWLPSQNIGDNIRILRSAMAFLRMRGDVGCATEISEAMPFVLLTMTGRSPSIVDCDYWRDYWLANAVPVTTIGDELLLENNYGLSAANDEPEFSPMIKFWVRMLHPDGRWWEAHMTWCDGAKGFMGPFDITEDDGGPDQTAGHRKVLGTKLDDSEGSTLVWEHIRQKQKAGFAIVREHDVKYSQRIRPAQEVTIGPVPDSAIEWSSAYSKNVSATAPISVMNGKEQAVQMAEYAADMQAKKDRKASR